MKRKLTPNNIKERCPLVEVTLDNRKVQLDLEKDFRIEEFSLEQNMTHAGHVLAYYGDLAADLKGQAARYKVDLDETESVKNLKLRASGDKLTVDAVKAKISTDPEYTSAKKKWIEAERDQQKVENLFRSQQKRVDVLIALAYKQRAEIRAGG